MAERYENYTINQAKERAVQAIDEAARAGRFMVAVWAIRDGKIGLSHRTTFNFERGDYLMATFHLLEHIREELEEVREREQQQQNPGPLPRARVFPKFNAPLDVPGEGSHDSLD